MGVGKESDIYLVTSPAAEASSYGGTRLNMDVGSLTLATNPTTSRTGRARPEQTVLKIHRLGRTSFRTLARNRAYHGSRQHCSWQYLSRLSAQKEYQAMCALHVAGFPVPRPIGWNRHAIVMSLVPGVPLRTVGPEAFGEVRVEEGGKKEKQDRTERIAELYDRIMELALGLAECGCIHGDFNEFNILVENVPDPEDENEDAQSSASHLDGHPDPNIGGTFESEAGKHAIPPIQPPNINLHTESTPSQPTPADPETSLSSNVRGLRKPLIPHLIDFPQITSLSHPQARSYFNRDITCIRAFFKKRYGFEAETTSADSSTKTTPWPTFEDALARLEVGERRRAAASKTEEQKSGGETEKRLDVQIEAMGYSKKMARELEEYYRALREEEGGDEADYDVEPGEAGEERDDGLGEVGDDFAHGEGLAPDGSLVNGGAPVVSHAGVLTGEDPAYVNGGTGEASNAAVISNQTNSDPALSSKMAAVSVSSKPEPKTRPKAAAGWSI